MLWDKSSYHVMNCPTLQILFINPSKKTAPINSVNSVLYFNYMSGKEKFSIGHGLNMGSFSGAYSFSSFCVF